MPSKQVADDILDKLMDEILNPPPVTDDDVQKLNEKYGFNKKDIFVLLDEYDSLKGKHLDLHADKYMGYAQTDEGHREIDWTRAFSDYQRSDEYTKRVAQKISTEKRMYANEPLPIGKSAKVVVKVDGLRSMVPVVGTVGTIIDGEYRVNSRHPNRSSYFVRLKFSLPLRLIDNEIYVNESILHPDVSQKDVQKFLDSYGVTAVWWQRENLDYHTMLFKADEIEILD